jgi:hypothetical protein
MPTYGATPTAPTVTEGYLVKAESRVLLGMFTWETALDITSTAYTTYGIHVGMRPNGALTFSTELGFLESVGFSYVPTWEAVDSANVASGAVYDMTSEELTLSIGLRQFNPYAIRIALNSGVFYTLGTEVLYAFGGGCTLVNRPIVIEFTNQACAVPTVPNVLTSGITGGILTAYDCICTSGLPWDAIARNEHNLLSLEFKGRPLLSKPLGRRLGSLFLY